MQFAILADDLTGATDSGAQLAHAGYRVAVMFHDASLPSSDDLDAIVVDTDSRQLTPDAAYRRASETTRRLRDAKILYKKIDSTLRGPVAEEIEAVFREGGRDNALIAPAFPGNGRTTRKGVQMVRGEPVHETRFSDDPVTPVREGHIPTLIAEHDATETAAEIGTLDVEDLGGPEEVRGVLKKYRWIVADATEDAHLRSLVESVPDPTGVLWVGSAGLVKALGEACPGPRIGQALSGETALGARVLIVVGSMNDVSREQLRRLESEPGVEAVALSAAALVAGEYGIVENALQTAGEFLGNGKSVALYATDEELPEGGAERVVSALSGVAAGLSEKDLFDALVLTGGDTAVHVSRELGAQGIMLEGEIEPGVATGALIGPRSYRIITKAGGFGNPQTLLHAMHTLKGKGKQS